MQLCQAALYFPEAVGLIKIIKCVIDSYLDRTLEPLQRIENMVCCIFSTILVQLDYCTPIV